MAGSDLTDLSSPWVELQSLYLNRSDYANAKWAIGIGCEQDDPNSHYAAALFEKKFNEHGHGVGTSGWLYHMTKAAASGHVRAMHELGVWYAQNGWPYLEDEPPDEIKPTPFDRYPAELGTKKKQDVPLRQRMRSALGLEPQVQEDPKLQVFHTAAHPSTPQQRLEMSLQWLGLAMGFMYAPSFLAAAQLHMEKTLWAEAATPKAALEMSDERYIYASKGDYEASRPIKREGSGKDQVLNPEQEIANPNYNPEKAKQLLREIIYASSALEIRQYQLKNFNAAARKQPLAENEMDSDEMALEGNLPQDMGRNVKNWFRYPEIREQFMNDRTGRLYDEVLGTNLLAEANRICDEQGWDIYAEDGGLLYRHGVVKGAAAPMAASAAR